MSRVSDFLPIAVPDISDAEIAEVIDSLRSGWISVGPKVREFEEMIAEQQGVKHAVAVSSCTSALFLVARSLGIGPGDDVIVPSMTWPSTANVIEQLGATPVFADVSRRTANMTVASLRDAVGRCRNRLKLVIPVHMSGLPVNVDGILTEASSMGIPVVFDAAHAIFSEYKGRPVGHYGVASCFSFYAIKNLTCGDGGVVVTDNDDLADDLRLWSYHGMSRHAWKRYSRGGELRHVECIVPGYKMNMTDLQAAIGIAQMRRFSELRDRRNQLVRRYEALLQNVHGVMTPVFETRNGHWGNHVYGVRILGRAGRRDNVMSILRERGIGTNVHFWPTHLNHFYRAKYPDVQLPNTEWLGHRLLSLPLCSRYSVRDINRAVRSLVDALKEAD